MLMLNASGVIVKANRPIGGGIDVAMPSFFQLHNSARVREQSLLLSEEQMKLCRCAGSKAGVFQLDVFFPKPAGDQFTVPLAGKRFEMAAVCHADGQGQ